MEARVATDQGDRGVFKGLSENPQNTDTNIDTGFCGKLRFPAFSP